MHLEPMPKGLAPATGGRVPTGVLTIGKTATASAGVLESGAFCTVAAAPASALARSASALAAASASALARSVSALVAAAASALLQA